MLGTDVRYLTQSAEQSPDLEVVIARASVPELASYAAEAGLGPLGFEAHTSRVAMYDALRAAHPDLPLLGTSGLVEDAAHRQGRRRARGAAPRRARIGDARSPSWSPRYGVGATERELARRLDWPDARARRRGRLVRHDRGRRARTRPSRTTARPTGPSRPATC